MAAIERNAALRPGSAAIHGAIDGISGQHPALAGVLEERVADRRTACWGEAVPGSSTVIRMQNVSIGNRPAIRGIDHEKSAHVRRLDQYWRYGWRDRCDRCRRPAKGAHHLGEDSGLGCLIEDRRWSGKIARIDRVQDEVHADAGTVLRR